jgi:hypothetical protein
LDRGETLAWLMITVNIIWVLAGTMLLWAFLRKHSGRFAAWIASLAFLSTNAILD